MVLVLLSAHVERFIVFYIRDLCGASCDYFPNPTPYNQSRALVAEEVKKLREKISDLKVQISYLRGHNPTSKMEMVGGQYLNTGSNNNTRNTLNTTPIYLVWFVRFGYDLSLT